MSSRHHTDKMSQIYDNLLLNYACGSLDDAHSMLLATYCALNPKARKHINRYETMGGTLLEQCEPEPLSQCCAKSIMENIQQKGQRKKKQKNHQQANSLHSLRITLPKPVEDYINTTCRGRLKRSIGLPGMRSIQIKDNGTPADIRIIRMNPGASVPAHCHQGLEITLVLEGAFHDEYGEYHAGDIVIYDETTGSHRPVANAQQGCVCLTLFDKPVHFHGPLGHILNLLSKL